MYTHKDFHLTCNMLLHYLVKVENPKMLLILTAENFSIPLYSLLCLYTVYFLPFETNYPLLAYEQPQHSPVSPPEQKSMSPSLVCPSPLSDLTISIRNHYDYIVLIIVLYYCVLFFLLLCLVFTSLASWLLFSNKVQFSSTSSTNC